jgi:predicted DCC family thiol-disulfide oxidoreductase YuxK
METILFYDGDCGFCNSMVSFVLKHERDHELLFCALQSDKAESILHSGGLKEIDTNTMYLKDKGRIFSRSDAALQIVKHLKWYFRILIVLKIVPRKLRDYGYDQIAKRRKRLRKGYCIMPEPEQRGRFLS